MSTIEGVSGERGWRESGLFSALHLRSARLRFRLFSSVSRGSFLPGGGCAFPGLPAFEHGGRSRCADDEDDPDQGFDADLFAEEKEAEHGRKGNARKVEDGIDEPVPVLPAARAAELHDEDDEADEKDLRFR